MSNAMRRSLSAHKGLVYKPKSAKDSLVRGPLPSTTSLVNDAWKRKEDAQKLNPTGIFKPLAPKPPKPAQPTKPTPVAKAYDPDGPYQSGELDRKKNKKTPGRFRRIDPKTAPTGVTRWKAKRYNRALTNPSPMIASDSIINMALNAYGTRRDRKDGRLMPYPVAKSVDKFTAKDRKTLDRKRALNPTISGVAAGTSLGALGANIGGLALRNQGQKKVFNEKTNDFEWKNREGATPKKMKLSRIGTKLQAKALPTSLVAGGVGAAAALNGIHMSHLWNKKDKVYTHVKQDVKKSEKFKYTKAEKAGLAAAGAGTVGGATLSVFGDEKRDVGRFKGDTGMIRSGKRMSRGGLALTALSGGIGSVSLLRRMQKQPVKKSSFDPEQSYRRRNKTEGRAALVGSGASIAGAGVLGGYAGRDLRRGLVQSASASEQGAAAGVVNRNAASAFAESAKHANKRQRGSAAAAKQFSDSGAKLNARAVELGEAAAKNKALSVSSFKRAGKFGAAGIGAAALGGGLMALSNKKHKEATSPRVFRRRTWNEPVLGGVSKGLLPMPLEMLLKKIADPEKRRRIKLGLQGQGPKLSAKDRALLMTISGLVGSPQAIQALGLASTPGPGPDFYRHGIRKAFTEEDRVKLNREGRKRRVGGAVLGAYGGLNALDAPAALYLRRPGVAAAKAGVAGAAIAGGVSLYNSGRMARAKAIDAHNRVTKSVFAKS